MFSFSIKRLSRLCHGTTRQNVSRTVVCEHIHGLRWCLQNNIKSFPYLSDLPVSCLPILLMTHINISLLTSRAHLFLCQKIKILNQTFLGFSIRTLIYKHNMGRRALTCIQKDINALGRKSNYKERSLNQKQCKNRLRP